MPKHTIRVLNAEDIHLCASIKDIIEAVRDAYVQFSSGSAVSPLRMNLPVHEHKGRVLYMPAWVPSCGMSGVKVVSDYEQNTSRNLPRINGLILLYDGETGVPKALLDGEYLTALRTGAASGVATDLLASKTASTAAIIGAGVQGETQLLAVHSVRKLQIAYIIDRDPEKGKQFVKKMQKKVDVHLVPTTGTEVLKRAQIICTATNSKRPVFHDQEIMEGAHINAIGAYLPDMVEVPAATVKRAKVVVDSREACLTEPGDLVQPIMSGLIDKSHIHAEIGEIAAGKKMGRTSAKEITFFKSVGIAVQDVVAAAAIFKEAQKKNLGITIQL